MKRVLSMLLAALLLVAALPTGAMAIGMKEQGTDFVSVGNVPAEAVEMDGALVVESFQETAGAFSFFSARSVESVASTTASQYQDMTSSQSLVDILKDVEGFYAQPYYDYHQYSIGYGCFAGRTKQEANSNYPNGITKAEAENLLRKELKTYEKEVNAYMRRIGRQPTQNQFDALVDFTYNVGGNWTRSNDYLINRYLMNPTTDLDFMRAVGSWCRAGGQILSGLCARRIRCALMFLYGQYYLPYGNVKDSNLKVVTDENLPAFNYCIFNGNGATLANGKTDDVDYFTKGQPYGSLPQPSKSNFTFAGWQRSDGSILSESTTVKSNLRLTAKWKVSAGTTTSVGNGSTSSNGGSGSTSAKPGTLPFKDVSSGSWYYSAAQFVYGNGYMYGVSDTMFDPEGTLTRGMLVTVLYRLAGKPAVSGSAPFKDVKSGAYYYDPVRWAKETGVVVGVSATEFRPDDLVTRQQIAAVLYRYYVSYLNKTPSGFASLSKFKDQNAIDTYAKEAISWAVGAKIMSGTSETTLTPRGNATRSQAAALIERFSKLI